MARISGQYGGQKLLTRSEYRRTKVVASVVLLIGIAVGMSLVFAAGVPIAGLAVLAVTAASAGFGNLFLAYDDYVDRWHSANDD
jgi:divalent metal cation (Fe/Co/Zn/Cd) transporter